MTERWRQEGMLRDYIAEFCKPCYYYRKGCYFDFGDSLTKISCYALQTIMKMDRENDSRKRRLQEKLGVEEALGIEEDMR